MALWRACASLSRLVSLIAAELHCLAFRGCVAASDADGWGCGAELPAVGLVVGGGAPDL